MRNIGWHDVESLLSALGAEVSQGRGSRVRVVLNGVRATFHEPHPEKEIGKGAVRSLRDFLISARNSTAGRRSRSLNSLKYKGYTGVVELDEGSAMLFGRVISLRDMITFQGSSVAEVIQAFHDSVDDYLEFCAERGESPEKPYSGQFVLRIEPRLHGAMAHAAERWAQA